MKALFETAIIIWMTCLKYVTETLTVSPEDMFDGKVWDAIVVFHAALLPVAYSLLVIWFLIGLINSVSSLKELKSLEHVFGMALKLCIAKVVVDQSLAIILLISDVSIQIMSALGVSASGMAVPGVGGLDDAASTLLANADAWTDLNNWIIICVLSILFLLISIGTGIALVMIVVARFYRLYIYAALSPIPLASFACGDPQYSGIGRQFLKSFMGVCMQAVVIYAAIALYGFFLTGLNTSFLDVFESGNAVVNYLVRAIFCEVLLLVIIKGSDQITKELGFA